MKAEGIPDGATVRHYGSKDKLIGKYSDVEVWVAMNSNPMDPAVAYCKVDNNRITSDIISFDKNEWENEDVLKEVFINAVGVGLSVHLQMLDDISEYMIK